MERISYEKATEELHALVRECDAETLAALYEDAFGAVKEAYVDTKQECLLVVYESQEG
jgi:hypothetical protein